MSLLSIIIPVYNVASYLRQTLDSLLVQPQISECEIILINDGSTDNSLSIAKEYEQRHDCLRVIDKTNEGVSATRNRGIAETKGDYIFFVDADDVVHPNALEIIIKNLKDRNPDILVWHYDAFYSKPRITPLSAGNLTPRRLKGDREEIFNDLLRRGTALSLYVKAVRRSLINDISLDTRLSYGEDFFFSWRCFLLAETVDYLPYSLYYYRQTPSGAVTKFHEKLYEKYNEAFEDIKHFAINQSLFNNDFDNDINYHFACRLPALIRMEYRAPYSQNEKMNRISMILNNKRIKHALECDSRLKGKIYDLARAGDMAMMLKYSKRAAIKSRLLFPLKKLLK